jgi:hypothetical protein
MQVIPVRKNKANLSERGIGGYTRPRESGGGGIVQNKANWLGR